jgi:hypothetical protein
MDVYMMDSLDGLMNSGIACRDPIRLVLTGTHVVDLCDVRSRLASLSEYYAFSPVSPGAAAAKSIDEVELRD